MTAIYILLALAVSCALALLVGKCIKFGTGDERIATPADFPFMLDEERAKYVRREIKYQTSLAVLRNALDQIGEINHAQEFSPEITKILRKAFADTKGDAQ